MHHRSLYLFILTLALLLISFAVNAQSNHPLPQGYSPKPIVTQTLTNNGDTLTLFAHAFAQGNAVYLEYLPSDSMLLTDDLPQCRIGQRPVHLTPRGKHLCAIFALSPDTPPGLCTLTIEYPATHHAIKTFSFAVKATPFPVSTSALNTGKHADINHAKDPAVQAFIAQSSEKKKIAFATNSPDLLLTSQTAHPRDIHHITSPFWSTRIYARYEIKNGQRIEHAPSKKIHRGLDFRGKVGDPVYAMAHGRVILAHNLYYEGNMVVVDHGRGVLSYYMHMDSLSVTDSQTVSAGTLIGTVGATGVSTGPHLHVSLVINGIQVNPLSLIGLPVR